MFFFKKIVNKEKLTTAESYSDALHDCQDLLHKSEEGIKKADFVFYESVKGQLASTQQKVSVLLKQGDAIKKETIENIKLRKKVVIDLKYHEIEKNYNKTTVLHIIINQEGRIVGYKPCNIFYPNYFTKNQLKKIINISKKYNLKKINLCMIKIKFYHAKIDL